MNARRGPRPPRPGVLLWAAAPLLALALLVACAPAYRGAPILGPLDTTDPLVARGERAFAEYCHSCHPSAGTGLGPGIADKPLPGWLIRFQVRNGLGQMPAFPPDEIAPEELDGIVAYIAALRERLLEAQPDARAGAER